MVLKRIGFLGMFIVFTACSVWGQVVVRDSVEVKNKLFLRTKTSVTENYMLSWDYVLPQVDNNIYGYQGGGTFFLDVTLIGENDALIKVTVPRDPPMDTVVVEAGYNYPYIDIHKGQELNLFFYDQLCDDFWGGYDISLVGFAYIPDIYNGYIGASVFPPYLVPHHLGPFPYDGKLAIGAVVYNFFPGGGINVTSIRPLFPTHNDSVYFCKHFFSWWNACNLCIDKYDSLDHFEINLNPDTIYASEKYSIISIQAKDKNNVDLDIPDETEMYFIIEGGMHGNLMIQDSVVADEIYISYGEANTGKLKFIYDGSKFWYGSTMHSFWIGAIRITDLEMGCIDHIGEGYVYVLREELDHFSVTTAKDTIAYSDTTCFYIQGKNSNNNNFDPSDETLLTCTLDPSSQEYGTLLGPDQTTSSVLENVPYADAKAGEVKFIANGDKPDSLVKVVVNFVVKEDASVKGDEEVMVKGEKVKLKITEPVVEEDEDKIFDITDTPEMPTIECKAKLSDCDEESIPEAQWECKVSYDYPPGSDEETYTEEIAFDEDFISEWDLDFKEDNTIIGGKAKIKVSTEIKEKTYSDSIIIYIRGENPNDDDVTEGLDTGEITMLETETSDFDQFDTEDYAEPNERLPLRSDIDEHGWGMCQIDDRWHTITTGLLWEWTENLTYGINYYNTRRNTAENLLETLGDLDIVAEGQTRQNMIDSEAYARYNGGGNARYWIWVPPSRTNPVGHWEEDPAMMINDEREYHPLVDHNVGRYLRHY